MHWFWNLDEIGISPTESFVFEKFESNIKFDNNSCSVKLPMKEYHPHIPGNYRLTLKFLYQLQEILAKDKTISRQYDEIIQSQLADRIIEELHHEVPVDSATYLLH